MPPCQPADVDRAGNLRQSSDYVHKLDSTQPKSAPDISGCTALRTPHPEGSASALVHLAGICSASTRPVRPTSPWLPLLPPCAVNTQHEKINCMPQHNRAATFRDPA